MIILCFLIHETLDAFLRSFLKLFKVNLDFRYLAISRQLLVQFYPVVSMMPSMSFCCRPCAKASSKSG